jgi:predicted nucleic acid-binding protein
VILVDSSAWIEFLRETGSAVHLRVRTALRSGQPLAWTDVVGMEILAGSRDDADRERLRHLLYGRLFLPAEGPGDYESAADLYRLCRGGGETPRKLTDCLIAAVAIRNEAAVLAVDADFEVIARHAPLKLATAG